MRIGLPLLLFCLTLASSGLAYLGAYGYFRSEEISGAEARLSVYRNTVLAELERFSHLTFVLARDPFVIETARGGDTERLNTRLASFAERAGIDAIYLMDADGLTRAASNAGTESSFVGQDYSFRPYFKTALSGAQGQFYGIGATTGIPGYFYAEAVKGRGENILGVVAIKIDLSALQESWRQGGEQVILSNADGVALLASEPDWRYRTLFSVTEDQRARIQAARQFAGQPLEPLDWTPTDKQTATIDGERLLYLKSNELPNTWSLHYFARDDRIVTRSTLVAGLVLLLAGMAVIWLQVQRTRRIGAALQRSELEEAQLRAANARLAVEIEERRTAERRLKRTQGELERAGRLAALGQLSASVTHELGQPIAAMRNQLAAAEIQTGQSTLTERLQSLVDRMEGITRQLKFFARKGRDEYEALDLRDALDAVLELMAPALEDTQVSLHLSNTPLMMTGNRLRVEQVLTNLLRNALDASDGPAVIDLTTSQDADGIWIDVADQGHGLGEQTIDELREPFKTSRESGQGMGLGLTISSGIVDDHGGQLTAWNRESGGAVFRAKFPHREEST